VDDGDNRARFATAYRGRPRSRRQPPTTLISSDWQAKISLFYLWLHLVRRDVYRIAMSAEASVTEAEIWSRTIRPGEGDLSPEAAREWLRLQLSGADVERVRELSSKANSGQLTGTEERELENYLNVGRTLEFLKAKARLSLRGHTPG
jgi:hypothetical protein